MKPNDEFWSRVYRVADRSNVRMSMDLHSGSLAYVIKLGYKDFEAYQCQLKNRYVIPFNSINKIIKVRKKYLISISPVR